MSSLLMGLGGHPDLGHTQSQCGLQGSSSGNISGDMGCHRLLLLLSKEMASPPHADSDVGRSRTEVHCLTFCYNFGALWEWGKGNKQGSFPAPSLAVAHTPVSFPG